MAKSGDRGGRRLDLTHLREALKRGASTVDIAVVTKDAESGLYYEIIDDDEVGADVLVAVQLGHTGQVVWARLGGLGGAGSGIWTIPREGTEVAVIMPYADDDDAFYGADPLIVAMFSSNAAAPDGLDEKGTIVIAVPPGEGGKVLIHDGSSGDCEPLVRKSDFDGHTHAIPLLTSPSGAVTMTPPPPEGPIPSIGDTGGAAGVDGTSILAAK